MSARAEILQKLYFGTDPFKDFPVSSHPVDHQGWNSDHPYLTRSVQEIKPRLVVEVGVWKGGSTKTMASALKENAVDGVVIAIDTYLGSSENWYTAEQQTQLRFLHGYPQLYHTMVANVFDKGLEDYVVPLPIDSLNAMVLLKHLGITMQLLHIDAGHDYESALKDLEAWWPMLEPGGILIGDDYYTDCVTWPAVKRAFDKFFSYTPHEKFEAEGHKCMIRKMP